MWPTLLGRVETRAAILSAPVLASLLLWLATASLAYPELIGLYLGQGWLFDARFYPYVSRWQPPWLTGVLGLAGFAIV